MYAHLNDPAPAASPLAPGTPAGLDVVIGTAMAKDPADRYESAGDLARAAWAALQGEVAPAPMGSVATGAAAEQAQPAPDTPAPRTPAPRTPPPASWPPPPPHGRCAGALLLVRRTGQAEGRLGPASWPRGRRIALLVALPVLLVAALAVAALGALGGGDDGRRRRRRRGRAAARRDRGAAPPAAQAKVVNTIEVGDGPDGITADGKRIFVSHAKDGTLREIDADLDQVVGEPVDGRREPRPDRRRQGHGLGGRRVQQPAPAAPERADAAVDRDDPDRQGRAGHLARRPARLGRQHRRRHRPAGRPRAGRRRSATRSASATIRSASTSAPRCG